ncbi:MAG: YIP1 family protein [Calditrichia bacterium]|nr:YIP1 family protein [Calditrichia bacterium]
MENNFNTIDTNQNKKLPLFQKLILIITNPGKVFENLALHPDWLLPTILIIVLAIGSSFLVYDIQLEAQKERFLKNDKIPDDRKELIMERFDEAKDSPTRMVQPTIAIIVITFISFAAVAGIFLLVGNFMFGGKAKYIQLLAVYAWGYMVAIPETLVKIPMMLTKNSIHVYTSLAVLFDPAESETVLFKIANAVDLFSIWRIALWAIGLGVVYKFSKEKSNYIVIGLYVIYVFIYIGISSLFGGLIG